MSLLHSIVASWLYFSCVVHDIQVINEARNNGSIAQDAICQLANYLFPQVYMPFR